MGYITTKSKIKFYPTNPNPNDILIEDIAHALSYLCRANGHCRHFFSVAQHSINCALEANARGFSNSIQLACLLHDASEAYISDITRPVKASLTKYLEIEAHLQHTIYKKFNIDNTCSSIVKEIDDTLLYYEFIELMDEKIYDIEPTLHSKSDFTERDFKIIKNEFLRIFHRLSNTN